MRRRLPSVLSWAVVPLALIALVATLIVGLPPGNAILWALPAVSLTFAGVGALLSRRRPTNPVGWLLAGWGLVLAFRVFAESYLDAASTSTSTGGQPGDWLAGLARHRHLVFGLRATGLCAADLSARTAALTALAGASLAARPV
ncbi:MAG: hypothetical protein NVS4B6_24040 [Mycobacterium sp.]